jgi:hypothetical protein
MSTAMNDQTFFITHCRYVTERAALIVLFKWAIFTTQVI